MSQFIASARAWLATITPDLPPAILIVAVFVAVFSLRRWWPSAWTRFEHAVPFVDTIDPTPGLKTLLKFWQALPAALMAAVTGALMGGTSVRVAVWGVVTAVVTAGSHEILADYAAFQGRVGGPNKPVAKPPSAPPLSVVGSGLMLCLAFVGGCAWFHSKLPTAEACAPTPAALAAQVADILAAGGDTTAALEQLALKQTEAAVVCAVEAFLGDAKVGASTGDAAEQARAKAYLKAKGAQ